MGVARVARGVVLVVIPAKVVDRSGPYLIV
jgi:hypothetical protein